MALTDLESDLGGFHRDRGQRTRGDGHLHRCLTGLLALSGSHVDQPCMGPRLGPRGQQPGRVDRGQGSWHGPCELDIADLIAKLVYGGGS